MTFQKIELRTNEYGNPDGSVRTVDQVELWGYGQVFRRDIRSDTDMLLVGKMAESLDLQVFDFRRRHTDARKDNMDMLDPPPPCLMLEVEDSNFDMWWECSVCGHSVAQSKAADTATHCAGCQGLISGWEVIEDEGE